MHSNAREEAYKKIFANESNGLGLGMDKVVFTPVNLKTVLEVYKDLGLDFIEINNEFDAGKGSAIKIDEKAESEPQFSYLTPGELAYAILFTKILSDENSERPSVNQIKSLIGDHFEAVYCLYLDWEKRGEQLADSLEDIFNKLLNDYYDETKADDEQGDDFTQTMQNALWVEHQIKNYNDKVNNNLFQNDEYSSR